MHHPSQQPHGPRTHERGIALVAAVLLLLLTSVLAGTFMASTSSERSISGNVHVARASLVAADAGVRVAQQFMANVGKTKLDSCNTAWTGVGVVVKKPDSLFKTGAYLVSSTNPRFTASGTVAFVDSALSDSSQTYDYQYTITSSGGFGAAGGRAVLSRGILRLSVNRGSFSDYLIFTNTHLTPSGSDIWFTSGTTFDGRVHTNGEFRFAYQPYFQDLVTSVNSRAWYYNTGNPKELNANYNGVKDVPEFHGGFTRGTANIPLPSNSFNQQSAALGLGGGSVAPTNNLINYAITGGASSSGSAPANGIYPVYYDNAGVKNMTGGFYIVGSLDSCTMYATGTGQQVYRLKQGATLKIITVDPAANTTSVKVGAASPVVYGGVPPANVLYVTGSISNLCGPNRPTANGTPPPTIAASNQLLITAVNDIVIQRDITYQDYYNGQNVLGIYSQNGSVRVGSNAPNDMRLDGFVMATGATAGFSVDNYNSGSPKGTFHLRGGMVSSYYGAFGQFNTDGTPAHGYNRDFHYDRRGFKPPFFPTTTRFDVDTPVARTLSWQEM